jgi:hypothetical protein
VVVTVAGVGVIGRANALQTVVYVVNTIKLAIVVVVVAVVVAMVLIVLVERTSVTVV